VSFHGYFDEKIALEVILFKINPEFEICVFRMVNNSLPRLVQLSE
jgi:hypothetical protein